MLLDTAVLFLTGQGVCRASALKPLCAGLSIVSKQVCRSVKKKTSNIKLRKWGRVQYHEVLSAEDDPEREQHGVEDALPDVSKKQHPGPVEANREPLHWDVDECH